MTDQWLALAKECRTRLLDYLAHAEPSALTTALEARLAQLSRMIEELRRGRAA